MMKKVSVVIPTYNPGKRILKTIGALKKQSPYEMIVVDDRSETDTSFLKSIMGIKFIRCSHGGAAKARNVGIKAAKGEIIAFIDDDCIPSENWLKNITRHFKTPEIGGVGGAYRTENKSLIPWLIGEEIAYRHSKYDRFIEFIGTYSAAFPKKVLEKVGGFDEDFKHADSEDNDLSYRIRRAGYLLVFEPRAYVYHHHPDTLIKYMKNQMRRAYWRVLLYKKHKSKISGDKYSGIRDFVQAPIAFFIILFSVLSPFLQDFVFLSLSFLVLLILMQIKESCYMIRRGGLKGILIIPLNVLRAFAWLFGVVWGSILFFFKRDKEVQTFKFLMKMRIY